MDGRGAQTRRAIVAAAIERFGRDGFRSTSVTSVARDVGLGPTATYPYFATKESLFFEAVDEDISGVMEKIFAGVGLEPQDPEWPGATLAAAFGALESHPLASRILAGLEPGVASRVLETQALTDARSRLAESLRLGQDARAVRTDIAAGDLAAGLVGLLLAVLAAGLRFGLGHGGDGIDAMMRTLHASVVPAEVDFATETRPSTKS